MNESITINHLDYTIHIQNDYLVVKRPNKYFITVYRDKEVLFSKSFCIKKDLLSIDMDTIFSTFQHSLKKKDKTKTTGLGDKSYRHILSICREIKINEIIYETEN